MKYFVCHFSFKDKFFKSFGEGMKATMPFNKKFSIFAK